MGWTHRKRPARVAAAAPPPVTAAAISAAAKFGGLPVMSADPCTACPPGKLPQHWMASQDEPASASESDDDGGEDGDAGPGSNKYGRDGYQANDGGKTDREGSDDDDEDDDDDDSEQDAAAAEDVRLVQTLRRSAAAKEISYYCQRKFTAMPQALDASGMPAVQRIGGRYRGHLAVDWDVEQVEGGGRRSRASEPVDARKLLEQLDMYVCPLKLCAHPAFLGAKAKWLKVVEGTAAARSEQLDETVHRFLFSVKAVMERLSAAIKLIEAAPEFADTKGLRSILKSPNQVFELRVRWKGQLVATRLFTAVNEEPEAAAPAAAPSRVSGRERKAKREWSPGLGVGKSYTMDTTDSLDAESSSASSDEEDGSNTNADAGSETSASLGDLSEDSASEETQSASAKISRGVASAPRGFTDWGHGDSCRGCRGGGKKHTCPKTRAGSGSPAATAIETRAESGSTNDDEARANSDASGTAVQATKKRSHKKKPAPAGAGSESDGSSTTVQAKKRPASTGAESGTSGTAVQAKKKRSHKKKPEPAADGESESDGSGTSVQAKKRPAGDASSGTAVPAKKKRKKIIRLPGDRPPVKLSVAPAERCRSMAEREPELWAKVPEVGTDTFSLVVFDQKFSPKELRALLNCTSKRKKSELTEVLMRVVRASKSEVSHVPARLGLV